MRTQIYDPGGFALPQAHINALFTDFPVKDRTDTPDTLEIANELRGGTARTTKDPFLKRATQDMGVERRSEAWNWGPINLPAMVVLELMHGEAEGNAFRHFKDYLPRLERRFQDVWATINGPYRAALKSAGLDPLPMLNQNKFEG
jgi:hypothetical protein